MPMLVATTKAEFVPSVAFEGMRLLPDLITSSEPRRSYQNTSIEVRAREKGLTSRSC